MLRIGIYLLTCLGLALLIVVLIGVLACGWEPDALAGPSAIIAAAIAGSVAIRASVTWSEQRRRDADASARRHHEEVYASLVMHLISAFNATGAQVQRLPEAVVRANVATWGSGPVVSRLAAYERKLYALPDSPDNGATGGTSKRPQSIAQKQSVQRAVADVILAVRAELQLPPVDREVLLVMLFEDYQPG